VVVLRPSSAAAFLSGTSASCMRFSSCEKSRPAGLAGGLAVGGVEGETYKTPASRPGSDSSNLGDHITQFVQFVIGELIEGDAPAQAFFANQKPQPRGRGS